MNKFLVIGICALMVSCFSEEGIELGKPSSFIRFYSDGYNNEAVSLLETDDNGFVILLNSSIQVSEADLPKDKICIIKTDQFGIEQWRTYYPPINDPQDAIDPIRYRAESFSEVRDNNGNLTGYLVAGQSIKAIGGNITSKFLIMRLPILSGSSTFEIDENLKVVKEWSSPYNTIAKAAINKKAVGPSNGNILFLAESSDPETGMIAGELNKNTLDSVAFIGYGTDFSSVLASKLFFNINNDSSFRWIGTANKTAADKSDIRFVTIPLENSTPTSDISFGENSTAESAQDVCLTGSVFATIGTIDDPTLGNNTNILFTRGSNQSTVYKYEYIPKADNTFSSEKNEVGNSISPTKDGGYIILASIDTYTGVIGRGDRDLLIMKINGFGDYIWSETYGTINSDEGKVIKQTSDGGYIALGTSRLAGTNTLILVKTDKDGQVD